MQINASGAGSLGFTDYGQRPPVAEIAAIVNDGGGQRKIAERLRAYQEITARWNEARPGSAEHDLVVRTVTQSPFAQQVRSALDAFSKAAWAGDGAPESERQAKALAAFDALSSDDQEIVFTLQGGQANGRPLFESAADYRASLKAQKDLAERLETAQARGEYRPGADPASLADPNLGAAAALSQARGPRGPDWTVRVNLVLAKPSPVKDTVDLSPQAQAVLAGGPPPEPERPETAAMEEATAESRAMAAATRAYTALS